MLKRSGVLVALALLLSVSLGAQEVIEQVLVRINGDILTTSEFEQRQVNALRTRPELANVNPASPELQRAVAELTPQLVLDAVDELLMVQRGRELGFVLGDEQFNRIVQQIKTDNNLTDEARFEEALKAEGLTMADLRRNLERQMFVSQVQQQEILQKISINDEEARAYYDSHKSEFTTPAQVTLREILIEVPVTDRGVNAAQDDEAKEEAGSIRNRLLGGEPFARLAAEVSDSGSKANGGLIGPISVQELAPALQETIAKLQVGDIAEPIRVQRGYQILKLEERVDGRTKTFEEARNDIGNTLGQQKLAVERLRYLEKLRAEATIVWHNDELKKAYEQALAQRRASAEAAAQAPAS
jgi:parvulin-like peptidyl-prolyl isomerase